MTISPLLTSTEILEQIRCAPKLYFSATAEWRRLRKYTSTLALMSLWANLKSTQGLGVSRFTVQETSHSSFMQSVLASLPSPFRFSSQNENLVSSNAATFSTMSVTSRTIV